MADMDPSVAEPPCFVGPLNCPKRRRKSAKDTERQQKTMNFIQ